jgi:hypothetical protein
VRKGLKDENSHIHQIYLKMLEERKIHFGPVHPTFVPSIVSPYGSPTTAAGIKAFQPPMKPPSTIEAASNQFSLTTLVYQKKKGNTVESNNDYC